MNQVNEKILKRYVGLDLKNTYTYFKILNLNISKNFTSNELENVFLEIDQETILGLELQRKLRDQSGGELKDEEKIFLPANLKLNKKNYRIKIRTKGVRAIHWKDKNKTSYKIDIRGNDRLWGMEEFSLQKPIVRNYTYEYLFHKLLGHVGLLNINYFFINLYLNDQNLGVYAVEESFSKELVERQGKRNGPIFSLKDELGEYFPNISYELYSDSFWINNHFELSKNLFSTLNNFKNNPDFKINDHFDLDLWAKYFAIMDLTGSYHGSLLKSVKLFYNPVTALFEPIGYDLHKGAGIFDNFILMDFLQEKNGNFRVNCSYLCDHKQWYMKFLKKNDGELNNEFIEKYVEYLSQYSQINFLDDFLKIHSNELSNYNNSIYKDNSRTDKINWVGAGYFIYDEDYLFNRAKLIRERINSSKLAGIDISFEKDYFIYEDYDNVFFPIFAQTKNCQTPGGIKKFFLAGKTSFPLITNCKKILLNSYSGESKELDLISNYRLASLKNTNLKKNFYKLSDYPFVQQVSNQKYKISSKFELNKNTIITKNETFIFENNTSINLNGNSILFVEGKINFNNSKKNLTKIFSEDGTGSVIFYNNEYNFKNLIFNNLSKPNLENYILYGGINFINSNVVLDNIYINNSNNEDGINIINSNSRVSNIYFKNIKADAFDLDFGQLEFKNINCRNINNDCLDISGAKVKGSDLFSENTFDKGVSVGENSTVFISNLKTKNNNVGIAVKDGSDAKFNHINFEKNKFDIILFNKKQEFLKPSLDVKNLNNLDLKKILQSKNTKLKINNTNYLGKFTDNYINSLIY
tara:strand:- start:83 stop:2506 length:2424 start_codon:yes stop_codon:yes gene_type:complete